MGLRSFYQRLWGQTVVGGIALGKSAFNQASAESPKERSRMAFRWFWKTLFACIVTSLIAGIPYYIYFGARTAAYAHSEGIDAEQITRDPVMRQTFLFVLALSVIVFLILGPVPFAIGVWSARNATLNGSQTLEEQAELPI